MNVTVKSKQGNWLMPTYPAKARFLLKQGKATVIQRTPFAIQLNEETTEYTQDIVVGIDDGGIHVGIACVANDEAIYQEEVQLRTDIKHKMDTRRIGSIITKDSYYPNKKHAFIPLPPMYNKENAIYNSSFDTLHLSKQPLVTSPHIGEKNRISAKVIAMMPLSLLSGRLRPSRILSNQTAFN